ncbi:MAG: ribonuclease M5 [Desulfitobacteriaceae bacterium]|nr:ribonuclease M5 [Desulfitobacteriaceae bacterium]MDI6879293.1 ribonuclease M5 [Desulfitobacteriaceae bacterium]MDI6915245.1 ribonuclease M5 [Desulfitobacteriaceae bacterium]
MIRELIVVEGKNDAHAVRRALGSVDIIWTEGYGLSEDKLRLIAEAAKRQGVIVFTDPDFVGGQIRERIRQSVPSAKHVYLSQEAARKKGDIGVENATPAEIQRAFAQIRQESLPPVRFTADILIETGLTGLPDSQAKRQAIGRALGIGECNAKQFLKRLNQFGVSPGEFWQAVRGTEG